MDRRTLLKTGLVGAIGMPMILPSRVWANSPNQVLNVAMVGTGLIHGGHRGFYLSNPNTRIVAICDVSKKNREISAAVVDRTQKTKVALYEDYQEAIDRPDVDIVLVCTPDHWHVAISMYALLRGKHVYCEKPVSLTVEEGRILADVAKKSGLVFQVGSQQRSSWLFRRAAELVRNGYLGNIKEINVGIGAFAPAPTNLVEEKIPDGFNYDKWLGPTPYYPYNAERVKQNYGGGWRCFLEYGARKEGDWGAHHFDIVQWALGKDNSGPTKFMPTSEKNTRCYQYTDDFKVFVNPKWQSNGITFVGEEADLKVGRTHISSSKPELITMPLRSSDTRLYRSNNHDQNFVDAILYGTENICPAEIGHRTATICQLSSIARRLNKEVLWDPKTEKVLGGNQEAALMLSRPRRAPYYLGV